MDLQKRNKIAFEGPMTKRSRYYAVDTECFLSAKTGIRYSRSRRSLR